MALRTLAFPGSRISMGIPGLHIAAFSLATFSIVSPKISLCSKLIEVTRQATTSADLVASSRPPNPVSRTIIDTPASLQAIREVRYVISKKVSSQSRSLICCNAASKSSFEIALPSTLTRSSILIK